MCGIVGILSKDEHEVVAHTLTCLKRLEYRGYDSVGVATVEGQLLKDVGGIGPFMQGLDPVSAKISIAHTRWATHGGVSTLNSHPHQDGSAEFTVVHNGIIQNTDELLASMPAQVTVSDTDTEVIALYFNQKVVNEKLTVREAIHSFFEDAVGTFAVLLMRKGDDALYALKRDSPLALAKSETLCSGSVILASDISAFGEHSSEAVFFDDNTYCVVSNKEAVFFDANGRDVDVHYQAFEWRAVDELVDYPHYMIKEIMEQPLTSLRLLESLRTLQADKLQAFADHMKRARRIVFLSCGTSYHASLIGAHLLSKLGYEAHTVIASEFENFILVDPSTFVIALSQSGETMDVIVPLKEIAKGDVRIGSIVNVPFSTIQRFSDISLDLLAGPEICVASTKAFTNQVLALVRIAECLGYECESSGIPGRIEETLRSIDPVCRKMAIELRDVNDLYVLGKGAAYPMAREIALKFKEIDYMHAEGMMAGELKHGTLALIEDGTPVICLIPDGDPSMISAAHEVSARGARTIVVSNTGEGDVNVPEGGRAEFGIYACLFGHLLSYYIGVERGLEIDKPRNLAKSVTVL